MAISDITQGSPAERSGLKPGDIIIALEKTTVTGSDDVLRMLSADRIGVATSITVISSGELRTVSVTPSERDER